MIWNKMKLPCKLYLHLVVGILVVGLLVSTLLSPNDIYLRLQAKTKAGKTTAPKYEMQKDILCLHDKSQVLMEDILCQEPPVFLKESKNPCWRQNVTQHLRCLPYFQLIGMDKCGSSDLFNRIAKHPEIFDNNGFLKKETMWWSWYRYGWFFERSLKKMNLSQYLNFFDGTAIRIETRIKTNHSVIITGDGTPMDMWDFRGWTQIPQNQGLKEPRILTPHLIQHINPKVKLIVILRNPVDRLYSDYFFISSHTTNKTAYTFHAAVRNAIETLVLCMTENTMRRCLYNTSMHSKWNHQARLNLGFYSVYMEEWLSVFPREQFFIMRTEDYSDDTFTSMQRLFKFLGVKQLTRTEMYQLEITSEKHFRETKSKKGAGPMLKETRELLTKLYKPFNDRLAQLLNDVKYTWTDTSL